MDYEIRVFDFATYEEREAFKRGVEWVNDSSVHEHKNYKKLDRFVVEYMEYK